MTAAPIRPSAHPASALPPGTRLGEFEVLSVLGIGGFGIVYLALDHALEREVAVKEYMPASLAGRTETMHVSLRSESDAETFALGRRSFVNEAKLLARFDHPSLLKVYRFWEANDTAYMAMPVYRGRTLKAVREAMDGPPDEAWVRALLLPLLGAVETLHAQEVYHRDIAPDNILLESDGRPVLLDFGAARRIIGDRSQALTAILKPAYAPIEQYAESASVRQGPWTDLYALGATLYFALTGRAPAPSTARALHDDVAPLVTLDLPGCSPALLQAIDWMLAPRPADRPQSVADLRAVLAGAPVPPPAVARTRVLAPRPGAPPPDLADSASAATVVDTSIRPAAPGEPVADLPLEIGAVPAAALSAGGAAAAADPPGDATSAAPAVGTGAAARGWSPPTRTARVAVPVAAALLAVGAGALWWVWPGATAPVPASLAASAAAAVGPAASAPPPAVRMTTPDEVPAATTARPSTAGSTALTAAPTAAPGARPAVARPPPSAAPGPRPAVRPAAAPTAAARPAPVAPPAIPPAAAAAPPPGATAAPSPPPDADAPDRAAPVAQTPPVPLSDAPEAICGKRVLLAQVLCMERECRTDAYENHPACRKWWQQNRSATP